MIVRSNGFGIGSVIFWGILLLALFGGDDSDNTEVNISEEDKPAITTTIKTTIKRGFEEGKTLLETAAETILEELDEETESKSIDSETVVSKEKSKADPIPDPVPDEEKSQEMIATPEQEEEEEPMLKSLNENKPADTGMKKL